jgi:hypothetical protein
MPLENLREDMCNHTPKYPLTRAAFFIRQSDASSDAIKSVCPLTSLALSKNLITETRLLLTREDERYVVSAVSANYSVSPSVLQEFFSTWDDETSDDYWDQKPLELQKACDILNRLIEAQESDSQNGSESD